MDNVISIKSYTSFTLKHQRYLQHRVRAQAAYDLKTAFKK